jgi:hypothetical protein
MLGVFAFNTRPFAATRRWAFARSAAAAKWPPSAGACTTAILMDILDYEFRASHASVLPTVGGMSSE